ncbi:hypothetical protein ZWY2020_011052 [Hordeum vulgare]|nr:hypothetical protein ZWY2020_011052 [Hordeum vulgare]
MQWSRRCAWSWKGSVRTTAGRGCAGDRRPIPSVLSSRPSSNGRPWRAQIRGGSGGQDLDPEAFVSDVAAPAATPRVGSAGPKSASAVRSVRVARSGVGARPEGRLVASAAVADAPRLMRQQARRHPSLKGCRVGTDVHLYYDAEDAAIPGVDVANNSTKNLV